MRNYRFSSEIDADFTTHLKSRVNLHFKESGTSKGANPEMGIKSLLALCLYLIPYAILIFGNIQDWKVLLVLFGIMGFAMAFIGASVMHDAVHESYSRNKAVKKIVGLSTWLLGVDPNIWKLQHNVLHHTYTNIEGADEDIAPRFVFRFSPHQPQRWFHRYQHIYAFFFYACSSLIWVFAKDFAKAFNYRKMGLLGNVSFPTFLLKVFVRKLVYLLFFLVVPLWVIPVPAGQIILLFVLMHLVAGTLLSMVFQPAHVMEPSEFIDQSEGNKIEENWLVHQLKTTTNFGTSSRLLFWFSGGLNHQIEHHLFPNICHIHYRKISKIVEATALEHGLPYHKEPTLGSAVFSHLKMLRALGKGHI